MNILTRDELKNLVEMRAEPCVSIYMPTEKVGQETRQNPIRLKNLLDQAEEQLKNSGMRTVDVESVLQPAYDLVEDHDFWQHQEHGLAIFLAPGYFHRYRLPYEVEERVSAADRFYVQPLFALQVDDDRYYILSLNLNDIRLFEGSRRGVREIDLQDMPTSLAEILEDQEYPRQLQFHSKAPPRGTGRGGGERDAIFFGSGETGNEKKEDIIQFFHKLDTGLREIVGGENVPLVLAGVDYVIPLYREANTYPHLLDDAVSGSPKMKSGEELHAEAWEIVRPLFDADREEAVNIYGNLSDTGQVSADVREIIPAAFFRRVDTLFLLENASLWGQFNPEDGTVVIHEDRQEGDMDLIDQTAVQTFLHGGKVYVLGPEEMPQPGMMSAVFRYSDSSQ